MNHRHYFLLENRLLCVFHLYVNAEQQVNEFCNYFDCIYCEVDRRVLEMKEQDSSLTPEALFQRLSSELPNEVRSRIADGELRSRIG